MIQELKENGSTRGFTLVQISIILTLAALVMVASLPMSQTTLTANRVTTTRMNAVLLALRQYQAANGVLPCPADASLATGSTNYGLAAAGSGPSNNCTGSSPAANFTDATNNVAIGMVPVRALGLSNDYALDGYGRDITYAVDTNTTAPWTTALQPGKIAVTDNGTVNNTVVALVSHGADGHGAWLPRNAASGSALRLNAGSTDTDQHMVNAHGVSGDAFPANYASINTLVSSEESTTTTFVSKPPVTAFDDLVVYKSSMWNINQMPVSLQSAITVSPPTNATYTTGQTLTFTLTQPAACTFTGTPQIDLQAIGTGNSIGTSNVAHATLASGSGTNTLTFTYTALSTDTAGSGIAVIPSSSVTKATGSIDLNGGTASGHHCVLTFVPLNLSGVVINPPSYVYVTSEGSETALAINPTTNTVAATIPLPGGVAPAVVKLSAGYAYVTDYDANKIYVISTATNTVTATIPVPNNPYAMAINGTTAYVAEDGAPTVAVINLLTNTVTGTITVGAEPYAIAVNGNYAYELSWINGSSNGTVSVIDTTSNTVVNTITVGSYPAAIAFNGHYAYVANEGSSSSNTVSVIDTSTNTLATTITVGASPWAFAVYGNYVYAVNAGGTVSIINSATNTVTDTITVGGEPQSITISGHYAYVVNLGTTSVSVIDLNTNTVIATPSVGNDPSSIGIYGNYAYVTNAHSASISVINITTNTVSSTIPGGSGSYPVAVAVPPTPPSPTIYIADVDNCRIRKVSGGIITTVAGNGTGGYSGDGGSATSAELYYPKAVAVDSAGNLYIADTQNSLIRKVTASTGIITTVAGNGTHGSSGDGGPATNAELGWIWGIAVDSSGNLYLAEPGGTRIRMVTASTGIITTVAGTLFSNGYNGDGIAATSAQLHNPWSVALDSSNNLYILDSFNYRIRKVTASTGIITTVAGNGTSGYSGDGGPATNAEFQWSNGVAVDSSGNIYISDQNNLRIRMVTASTGVITTIAGNGTYGYSGDGGPATSAAIGTPQGVAVDSSGNLYILDGTFRVRMVTASTGVITTIAGNGTTGYNGDGIAATSAGFNSSGLAVSGR